MTSTDENRPEEVDAATSLFVEALLREALEVDTPTAQEQAAQALGVDPNAGWGEDRTESRSRWGHRTALATAAALMLVALWLWWPSTEKEAPAELIERVLADSKRMVDRAYQFEVKGAIAATKRHHLLYTRGPDRIVLQFHMANGRRLVLGRNGESSWLVPARPERPVLTADSLDPFTKVIERQGLDLLAMDLRFAIAKAGGSYRFEQLSTPDTEPGQIRFRAIRWSEDRRKPKRFTLLVEAASGKILQMTAQWDHRIGRPRARTITLTLTSEAPLAPDWFEHEAHHATDRPVQRR